MTIYRFLLFLTPLALVGCAFPGDHTADGTMQGRTYSPADHSFSINVPESDSMFRSTDEKRGTTYLADFIFASTTGSLVYSIECNALPSGSDETFLAGWEKKVQNYLNSNFGEYGRYQLRNQQRIRLSGGQQASLFVAQGNHNMTSKPGGVIYGCAVRFERNWAVLYVLRSEPKLIGPTNSLPGMKDFLRFANSLRIHE